MREDAALSLSTVGTMSHQSPATQSRDHTGTHPTARSRERRQLGLGKASSRREGEAHRVLLVCDRVGGKTHLGTQGRRSLLSCRAALPGRGSAGRNAALCVSSSPWLLLQLAGHWLSCIYGDIVLFIRCGCRQNWTWVKSRGWEQSLQLPHTASNANCLFMSEITTTSACFRDVLCPGVLSVPADPSRDVNFLEKDTLLTSVFASWCYIQFQLRPHIKLMLTATRCVCACYRLKQRGKGEGSSALPSATCASL